MVVLTDAHVPYARRAMAFSLRIHPSFSHAQRALIFVGTIIGGAKFPHFLSVADDHTNCRRQTLLGASGPTGSESTARRDAKATSVADVAATKTAAAVLARAPVPTRLSGVLDCPLSGVSKFLKSPFNLRYTASKFNNGA